MQLVSDFLVSIDNRWMPLASDPPILRQTPRWHPLPLNSTLRHFEIEVLDVVDVVVSKLKRLHADDATDIEAMVERGLVSHAPDWA